MGIVYSAARVTNKSKPLVLIIDHYHVGQRIALLQLNHLGYGGEVVENCRQAIRSVKKTIYDAIFIGWGMPSCDGALLIKYVRRLDKKLGTHTPIIGVTIHALSGDNDRCVALGMDDLLSKPIAVEDMERVLARHVKKAA